MPLTLQPAKEENATQRAEVQMVSWADDPLVPSLMPSVPYEEKLKFLAHGLLEGFGTPGIKDLEIIDTETGKVVAFARWKYPVPKPAIQEKDGSEDVVFPEGANIPLCKAVFSAFGVLVEKHYDSEKMYFLTNMHVHPDYQRRGLGQRFMEQALIDADRDGAQAFLLASDAGKHLYSKSGFVDLEKKNLDFVHLGAGGKRNTTAQMRQPKSIAT